VPQLLFSERVSRFARSAVVAVVLAAPTHGARPVVDGPQITITPANGSVVTQLPFNIVVTWCDVDGTIKNPRVWLDGTQIASSFMAPRPSGCFSGGTTTVTITSLAYGSHTISAQASDNLARLRTASSTFTYPAPATPITAYRPDVKPDAGFDTAMAGDTRQVEFFVFNVGTQAATYTLAPGCSGMTCAVTPTTVFVAPGGSQLATVSVSVPASAGVSVNVPLAATYRAADGRAIADTGLVTLNVGGLTYTPSLRKEPVSDTVRAYASVGRQFFLRNAGTAAATYSLQATCGAWTNCATQSSVSLQPNEERLLPIAFTTDVGGVSSTIRVIATAPPNGAGVVEADTLALDLTAADLAPPQIGISPITAAEPGQTVRVTTRSLTLTVDVCDPDGSVSNPVVFMNGVEVSHNSLTTTTASGCHTSKRATYPVVANAGMNTLYAWVSDGIHITGNTWTYEYDPVVEHKPVVTPRVASEQVPRARAWTDTFFVQNPGTLSAAYGFTAVCNGSDAASCSASPTAATVGPGQSTVVVVSFTTPSTVNQQTTLTLTASYSTAGSSTSTSASMIATTTSTEAPQITLTPANGATLSGPTIGLSVAWCDADDQLATHDVFLDGQQMSSAFVGQAQTNCVSAGVSTWTSINVSSGSHMLTARATDAAGHVTDVSSTFTVQLSPLADFQPDVSPAADAGATLEIPLASTARVSFAVRNAGSRTAQYQLTAACGGAANCQVTPATLTLGAGVLDSARVSFNSPPTSGAMTLVTAIARYQDTDGQAIADTGSIQTTTAPATDLYQPRLTPQTLATTLPPNVGSLFSFTLTNVGRSTASYTVWPAQNGGITFPTGTDSPQTIVLGPGQSTTVWISARSPATEGTTGYLWVFADASTDGAVVRDSRYMSITALTTARSVVVKTLSGTTGSIPPGATSASVYFLVTNTTGQELGYTYVAECSGLAITCRYTEAGGAVSEQTATISPGGERYVPVYFDVGSGTTGAVRLLAYQTDVAANRDSAIVTYGAPPPAVVAVAVTPTSITQTLRPNEVRSESFTITSTSGQSSFSYTVMCTGSGVSCSAASGTTPTLVAGGGNASVAIPVVYTAGRVNGRTGVVKLVATSLSNAAVRDSGMIAVTVGTPAAITVSTRGLNPDATIARNQCLTIAAGDNTAYECGDLRVVHPLPAIMTMNTPRVPTLIYNSAHARGHVTIAANVSVASGVSPGTLRATVKIANKTITRDIAWNSAWSDGRPRRIAVGFDALTYTITSAAQPAGLFPYTLEVRALADATMTGSDTGSVVIVDRSQGPFGQGWWLDGLEQLSVVTPDTSQRLWIGGDGSSRLYVRKQPTIWTVTPTMDRPDTLERVGTGYRRHLPNGAYVEFDYAGHHVATVNALGHATRFQYPNGTLGQIDLPMPGSISRSYVFNYGATGRVESIDPPPGPRGSRRVLIGHPSSGNTAAISSITDPAGSSVEFQFDAAGLIIRRTNRLGDITRFGFDPAAQLLVADTIDMRGESVLVARFCPAEGAGLASCAGTPQDTGAVTTRYVAPRFDGGDVTKFFVTGRGGPRRIVDTTGKSTTIERNDARWPLLATAVVDPNGHRVEAVYDSARALILQKTDVNGFAVTLGGPSGVAVARYEWDPTCDEVTKITGPTGEMRTFTYDHPRCTRHSQMDGRGDSTAVFFGYEPAFNRLRDITYKNTVEAGSGPERFEYDDTSLGNLRSTTTPKGTTVTIDRDSTGLDTLTITPLDGATARLITRTVRDVLGRDTMTVTRAPRGFFDRTTQSQGYASTAVDSTVVRKWFNREDDVDSLERSMFPSAGGILGLVTRWTYDAAGRKRSEIAPDGASEDYVYGDGVNVTSLVTRNRDVVAMRYDRLNRLVAKALPPTSITKAGYTLQVPAQVDSFEYDAAGRMTAAINPFATVRREYTIGGHLRNELQRLAAANGALGQHDYLVQYEYDLAGRRRHLSYPNQLSTLSDGDGSGWLDYTYNAGGLLETITIRGTRQFTYAYDARGRRTRLTAPNGVVDLRTYDDDDRLIRLVQRAPSANLGWFPSDSRNVLDTIRADVIARDLRDRAAHVSTYDRDHLAMAYNGLGALREFWRQSDVTRRNTETGYELDPLGNVLSTTTNGFATGDQHNYDARTGRLLSIIQQSDFNAPTIFAEYDVAGNQTYVQRTRLAASLANQGQIVQVWTNTQNAYDANGRLRLIRERPHPSSPGFAGDENQFADEETRYDALGRRVWLRSAHVDTSLYRCTIFCSVTRFVWDGEQILGEFRMPVEQQENDVTPISVWEPVPDENGIYHKEYTDSVQTYSWRWGRVAYAHGLGIDQPIAITRDGGGDSTTLVPAFTMYTMTNWRGDLASMSFANGGPLNDGGSAFTPPLPNEQNELLTAYRERGVSTWAVSSWVGSLANGQVGETGLEYRRNRYYDPQQGRFTQEDPIGLAGGVNLYGFGNGDAVNSSDPFGLCPPELSVCLFSGVWDRFVAKAMDVGQSLIDLTPAGDAQQSVNAFSNRRPVAGLVYGTMAVASIVPSGGPAKVAGKIVIGETATRVQAYAAKIGAETFTPVSKDFIGMMRENAKWLREKIAQGYEIVDIGLNPQRTDRGPFYIAERKIIERTGANVTKP
jgi:RHS repeat-associated protein